MGYSLKLWHKPIIFCCFSAYCQSAEVIFKISEETNSLWLSSVWEDLTRINSSLLTCDQLYIILTNKAFLNTRCVCLLYSKHNLCPSCIMRLTGWMSRVWIPDTGNCWIGTSVWNRQLKMLLWKIIEIHHLDSKRASLKGIRSWPTPDILADEIICSCWWLWRNTASS